MSASEIFVIHDPLREDREKLYRKELYEQGIDLFESIPAVKDYVTLKNIAEAHKNCIKKAIKRDLPIVVVMEDDVKFACPGAYNHFLELITTLPEDWDIFTSGSYDYKVEKELKNMLKLSKFSGLHCYAVNQRFYGDFLKLPDRMNIDKQIKGNIYMAYPMLALQYDTYSDNVKKVTNYNEAFKNKIKLWDCSHNP